MRFLTDENSEKQYKEFLERHERCNFQQSPEWAKVKSNWKNEVVLAEDENGTIIGAVSVLIRKIPIFGNIMYSSRGPTCDIHDISVMKQLTDGIKEVVDKDFTTGEEKVKGKKYDYEEYNGSTMFMITNTLELNEADIKTRFYFDKNGNLTYIKTIYGEDEELLKVNLEIDVDDSIFEIPSDYAEN